MAQACVTHSYTLTGQCAEEARHADTLLLVHTHTWTHTHTHSQYSSYHRLVPTHTSTITLTQIGNAQRHTDTLTHSYHPDKQSFTQ